MNFSLQGNSISRECHNNVSCFVLLRRLHLRQERKSNSASNDTISNNFIAKDKFFQNRKMILWNRKDLSHLIFRNTYSFTSKTSPHLLFIIFIVQPCLGEALGHRPFSKVIVDFMTFPNLAHSSRWTCSTNDLTLAASSPTESVTYQSRTNHMVKQRTILDLIDEIVFNQITNTFHLVNISRCVFVRKVMV